MSDHWGPIDFQGSDHSFDCTNYYEPEMGADLKRTLISFERFVAPESIVDAKLRCNELEDEFAEDGKRFVNLDIGYLDHNKIVLASCKPAGQKIHLRDGIYADLVARYAHGRYQPFEWTFPDFKSTRYDAELQTIRSKYLGQRKATK